MGVTRNRRRSGSVSLLGFTTTTIDYDGERSVWRLTEHSHNTTSKSKAPFNSFALGSHMWLVESDNPECSEEGAPYTRRLKLTGCLEEEFTCSDGQVNQKLIIEPLSRIKE